MAQCPATVSQFHFPSGFGDEAIIDKNKPTINKPATKPEINIFVYLTPYHFLSNPLAAILGQLRLGYRTISN